MPSGFMDYSKCPVFLPLWLGIDKQIQVTCDRTPPLVPPLPLPSKLPRTVPVKRACLFALLAQDVHDVHFPQTNRAPGCMADHAVYIQGRTSDPDIIVPDISIGKDCRIVEMSRLSGLSWLSGLV